MNGATCEARSPQDSSAGAERYATSSAGREILIDAAGADLGKVVVGLQPQPRVGRAAERLFQPVAGCREPAGHCRFRRGESRDWS
jgi:hypothetical protein